MLETRGGDASDEHRGHERIVVGTVDQGDEDQGVQHGEREGLAGIAASCACQFRNAEGQDRYRPELEQPKRHHRSSGGMEGYGGDEAVEHQEQRPIRCWGVAPEGVHRIDIGASPEGEGSIDVGIDVMAHHLTLGGIAEDISTEHWCGQEHGDEPEGQHGNKELDRDPRATTERLGQLQPDSEQEHETAVDQQETQHEQRLVARIGSGGGGGRNTEGPRPGHLELEG